MKLGKHIAVIMLYFCTMPVAFGFAGGKAQISGTPSIAVVNSRYEFEPVPDGTKIIHDFIVHNKGSAPLTIQKVKTP